MPHYLHFWVFATIAAMIPGICRAQAKKADMGPLGKWHFTTPETMGVKHKLFSFQEGVTTISGMPEKAAIMRSNVPARVLPGDMVTITFTASGSGGGSVGYQEFDSCLLGNIISTVTRPFELTLTSAEYTFAISVNSASKEAFIRPIITLNKASNAKITKITYSINRKELKMPLAKSYNGETPPVSIEKWEISKFWDVNELFKVPAYHDLKADEYADSQVKGLRSILFDGMAQDGVKNQVFGYIGYPEGEAPEGGFPALVLVHGGGGTAYPNYTRLWNKKGYVTITIDMYNSRPIVKDGGMEIVRRVPLDGQKFVQFGISPESEKHVIKCIGNIVLANSILRSLPGVNVKKTGLIGISWGSVFASVVSCIDDRLNFIIPVYGHGFYGEGDGSSSFCKMSTAAWEPGHFLHSAKVPLYWLSGTNDLNFLPPCMQRSWDTAPTTANHTLVIKFPHSHVGYQLLSTVRIVDSLLKDEVPLPKLGKCTLGDNGLYSAEILEHGKGIKLAQLCYTTDDSPLALRAWNTLEAKVQGNRVSAVIPPNAIIAYLIVFDEQSGINGPWHAGGSSDIVFRPVTTKSLK